MKNIAIVGASGHAKVVIDIVERQGTYRIAGLLDSVREVGESMLGYQVLGQEQDLPDLVQAHQLEGAIVAIGDNFTRSELVSRINQACPTLPLVSAIHPSAAIARDVQIGPGSVIMAGAVLNSCASIGNGCIINTHASLDHDSVMGNFSSLAPGVATGGNCTIGTCSAVGIGAVLSHGIQVGEHTVIGAGATVLNDIADFRVAHGLPAVEVRTRKAGERYL